MDQTSPARIEISPSRLSIVHTASGMLVFVHTKTSTTSTLLYLCRSPTAYIIHAVGLYQRVLLVVIPSIEFHLTTLSVTMDIPYTFPLPSHDVEMLSYSRFNLHTFRHKDYMPEIQEDSVHMNPKHKEANNQSNS